MRDPLTARQQQALDFIANSITERGYPPTMREIGTEMGISSTNGVNDHLKALVRKGYLVREELKSRALRPVDQGPTLSERLDAANERIAVLGQALLDELHRADFRNGHGYSTKEGHKPDECGHACTVPNEWRAMLGV